MYLSSSQVNDGNICLITILTVQEKGSQNSIQLHRPVTAKKNRLDIHYSFELIDLTINYFISTNEVHVLDPKGF